MNVNKLFLVVGMAVAIGAAAPAEAGKGCWWGKCGGGSSGGGSSGGSPTPVPEPEQMALFGMGVAALGARFFVARRKQK